MNHGSEAIVRGTVAILRKFFDHTEIISAETERYPYSNIPEKDPGIIHKPLYWPKRGSFRWLKHQLTKYYISPELAYGKTVSKIMPEVQKADVVLSLGGDGYTHKPSLFMAENNLALKEGVPTVLWGASIGNLVGSEKYRKKVFDHLKTFTALFIRETVSRDYLRQNGVVENVHLVEDPAFIMEPEIPDDCTLAQNEYKESIGISLSRLFLKRTRYHNEIEKAVYDTIEAIRKKTGRPIVLIPHCVADYDDDYALLESVRKKHSKEWHDVICLPKMLPAAQIKWIISKLHALVAARTHATIAAFSTSVPTVSIAYSFKAEGLNKRLFDGLNYVVMKDHFTPENVVERLDLVLRERNLIKNILKEKRSEILNGSMRAGVILKEILRSKS